VNIRTVEFAGAVARPGGRLPDRLPQVAFTGRSNVGKSSLINCLLGRTQSRLARVSVTPGRTQEINFYRVGAHTAAGELRFFLVDLPGYGYARVPEAVRSQWRPLIDWLLENPDLKGVVQLIDARHGPTAEDLAMVDRLANLALPTVVALTKFDKIKASQRRATIESSTASLGVDAEQLIPFSSRTREGRQELLESLEALLTE
jgi:GTP-binding protein